MRKLRCHPRNRSIVLDNRTCVYCGIVLRPQIDTKEHVIGRKFVPMGTLGGQWNLIVRACLHCNGTQADLENDISAISMQPDAFGTHAHGGELLAREAARKAEHSVSRWTRKVVTVSNERQRVIARLGPNVTLSADFIGIPHIDPNSPLKNAVFERS